MTQIPAFSDLSIFVVVVGVGRERRRAGHREGPDDFLERERGDVRVGVRQLGPYRRGRPADRGLQAEHEARHEDRRDPAEGEGGGSHRQRVRAGWTDDSGRMAR